jgi:hypothetical protein
MVAAVDMVAVVTLVVEAGASTVAVVALAADFMAAVTAVVDTTAVGFPAVLMLVAAMGAVPMEECAVGSPDAEYPRRAEVPAHRGPGSRMAIAVLVTRLLGFTPSAAA